ncbi:MAG TPA: glutamine-hydrolyzing GMP synthase [bacterium]|nr:glutamine-hydrolyzing GMP synthase [bacterium]
MDNQLKLFPDKDLIIVLDFGAQYNQLIARRVRECNVYSEVHPHNIPIKKIVEMRPKGIILSGGPSSVYDEGAPKTDPQLFELGIPILGICYGMQLMGLQLNGRVGKSERKEFGRTEMHVDRPGILFEGLNPQLICWMSHGDIVLSPPPGFEIAAHTNSSPVAAMSDLKRNFHGVQFHPEVVHTPWGIEIIRNFALKACRCKGNWTMENYVDIAINDIRERVGKGKVLCALSGGVDSSAVAVLCHKAIGKNLNCVYVDHGLMRKGESAQVVNTFQNTFKINLAHVNAKERFLKKLFNVTSPERKRHIIGHEFIRVFEEEAKKFGKVGFLAQGTLYPDVIESHSSGTGKSVTIKSHHNVGGLPKDMKFELIEPLRFLFKDEVRALCTQLGIPREITWRQPFPGPGLAIRIIGKVTEERIRIIQDADEIIMEEIRNAGLQYKIWQTFAVLPAIKSVGVMGDKRTYAHPIIIRAVTSEDGMTSDWARLDYDLLEKMSNRIVNEVKGVNRVAYDITSKPPGTIEWE